MTIHNNGEVDEMEETEIIEDWSDLNINLNDDCGGVSTAAASLSKFTNHSESIFPLTDHATESNTLISSLHRDRLEMKLQCVCELTPLDMLDLYHGRADATGNRIWMGALLFIETFVRPLPLGIFSESADANLEPVSSHNDHTDIDATRRYDSMDDDDDEDEEDDEYLHECLHKEQMNAYYQLRMELFHDKMVLELGAGTGASGIALAMCSSSTNNGCLAIPKPSFLTMTDNDANVLSLCQKNCDINLGNTCVERGRDEMEIESESEKRQHVSVPYAVVNLEWGNDCLSSMQRQNINSKPQTRQQSQYQHQHHQDRHNSLSISSQDTIVATDVIYDLSALRPLMETSQILLKHGGYLVLSHVPRASIETDQCSGEECKENGDVINVNTTITKSLSIGQALENRIVKEAGKHGLEPLLTNKMTYFDKNGDNEKKKDWMRLLIPSGRIGDLAIRPNDLQMLWGKRKMMASSDFDYEDMESVGASILIFVKTSASK